MSWKNFPVDDWKHQVANDETRLSYLKWAEQKARSAAADLSDKYPDAIGSLSLTKKGPLARSFEYRHWEDRESLRAAASKQLGSGGHTPTLRERIVRHGILWPLIMIGLPTAAVLWVVAVSIVF